MWTKHHEIGDKTGAKYCKTGMGTGKHWEMDRDGLEMVQNVAKLDRNSFKIFVVNFALYGMVSL